MNHSTENENLSFNGAEQKLFRKLYDRSSVFYRATAIENLLESIPRDYGTGELSNMTEAHMVIDVVDNDGITVGELADMSGRTPSAVSQIVTKLEKKNYVYKQRCVTNYRSYHIYPTEKGRALAAAHKEYDVERMSAMEEYLRQSFTDEEIDTFYNVLAMRTKRVHNIVMEARGNK